MTHRVFHLYVSRCGGMVWVVIFLSCLCVTVHNTVSHTKAVWKEIFAMFMEIVFQKFDSEKDMTVANFISKIAI